MPHSLPKCPYCCAFPPAKNESSCWSATLPAIHSQVLLFGFVFFLHLIHSNRCVVVSHVILVSNYRHTYTHTHTHTHTHTQGEWVIQLPEYQVEGSQGAILEAVYHNIIFRKNKVHDNTTQNYEQFLVGHSPAWHSEKVKSSKTFRMPIWV